MRDMAPRRSRRLTDTRDAAGVSSHTVVRVLEYAARK
jgi:hypothetical protein